MPNRLQPLFAKKPLTTDERLLRFAAAALETTELAEREKRILSILWFMHAHFEGQLVDFKKRKVDEFLFTKEVKTAYPDAWRPDLNILFLDLVFNLKDPTIKAHAYLYATQRVVPYSDLHLSVFKELIKLIDKAPENIGLIIIERIWDLKPIDGDMAKPYQDLKHDAAVKFLSIAEKEQDLSEKIFKYIHASLHLNHGSQLEKQVIVKILDTLDQIEKNPIIKIEAESCLLHCAQRAQKGDRFADRIYKKFKKVVESKGSRRDHAEAFFRAHQNFLTGHPNISNAIDFQGVMAHCFTLAAYAAGNVQEEINLLKDYAPRTQKNTPLHTAIDTRLIELDHRDFSRQLVSLRSRIPCFPLAG